MDDLGGCRARPAGSESSTRGPSAIERLSSLVPAGSPTQAGGSLGPAAGRRGAPPAPRFRPAGLRRPLDSRTRPSRHGRSRRPTGAPSPARWRSSGLGGVRRKVGRPGRVLRATAPPRSSSTLRSNDSARKRIPAGIRRFGAQLLLDAEQAGCTSRPDRCGDGAPALIWPTLVATARSAIVVSSVSPERCDITARSRASARARSCRASPSACRSG